MYHGKHSYLPFLLLFILGSCSSGKFVNLGLPSGTKWAKCNIGAQHEGDAGDYFAWGETEAKAIYEWYDYKFYTTSADSLSKYNMDDHEVTLKPADDVASMVLGRHCHIPTVAQWRELMNECTWEYVEGLGCKATGPNKKSILLPISGLRNGKSVDDMGRYGNYWTQQVDSTKTSCACGFTLTSRGRQILYSSRCLGFTIRAVKNRKQK